MSFFERWFGKKHARSSDTYIQSLRDEQSQLISEIEALQEVVKQKALALQQKLHECTPEQVMSEANELEIEQQALAKLIQRVHVALSDRESLEREYLGWQHQKQGARKEMIESEFRIRGLRSENLENISEPKIFVSQEAINKTKECVQPVFVDALPFEYVQADDLVRAIEESRRETRRWKMIADSDPAGAVDQIKHFRELHGHLRQADKKTHTHRVRFELFF